MAEAVRTNSMVGGENACRIVSKMIEDLPYKWKPTVPLSGRVGSNTK